MNYEVAQSRATKDRLYFYLKGSPLPHGYQWVATIEWTRDEGARITGSGIDPAHYEALLQAFVATVVPHGESDDEP